MEKECKICNIIKPVELFANNKLRVGGKTNYCKECHNKKQRDYRATHKEQISLGNKEYRKRNKEKVRQAEYRWHKEHDFERTPARKEWRKRNNKTPKIAERKRLYMREYNKREKRRLYNNALRAKRRKEDPNFQVRATLRSRLHSGLKARNIIKKTQTVELIGCSFEFLRIYLESQFTNGMTWDNHSPKGWHIDHIRPLDSFDLTDIEQQKTCFHYSNLRPLWAVENWKKGAKLVA